MKSKSIPFKNLSAFYPDVLELVGGEAVLERKALATDLTTALDNGSTLITGIFSTSIIDHDGDIVISSGVSTDYFTGVCVWNHELSSLPIGKVEDIRVTSASVSGTIRLAKDYSVADDIATLCRQGILRGISLGFIPKKVLFANTREFNEYARTNNINTGGCKRIIVSCDLIEVSLVTVGANRAALINAVATKSLHIDTDMERAFDIDPCTQAVFTDLISRIQALEAKSIDGVTVTKPLVHNSDGSYSWGQYTNTDLARLRDQVYAIWVSEGSKGDFATYFAEDKGMEGVANTDTACDVVVDNAQAQNDIAEVVEEVVVVEEVAEESDETVAEENDDTVVEEVEETVVEESEVEVEVEPVIQEPVTFDFSKVKFTLISKPLSKQEAKSIAKALMTGKLV